MILNSAVDQAYKNYTKKLETLYKEAIESKDDDEKAVLCAAMVGDGTQPKCKEYEASSGEAVCKSFEVSSPFDNIFATDVNYGISSAAGGTKMVIAGAKIDAKLKAASSGKGEYVSTDANGSMVAKISVTATYSSKNNVCKLVTSTMMCENSHDIITTNSGSGWAFGFGATVTTQKYQGTVCDKYAEPITTENEIAM